MIDEHNFVREFDGINLSNNKNNMGFGPNIFIEDFNLNLKYNNFDNHKNDNFNNGDWEHRLSKSQEYKESIEYLMNPSIRKYIESRDNFFYSYLEDLKPSEIIAKKESIEMGLRLKFNSSHTGATRLY